MILEEYANDRLDFIKKCKLSEVVYEAIDETIMYPKDFPDPANVMAKETGLTIECRSNELEEAVMLSEAMPWKFNEKEKDITIPKPQEYFAKYFEELGVEVYPEYCRVEMFG